MVVVVGVELSVVGVLWAGIPGRRGVGCCAVRPRLFPFASQAIDLGFGDGGTGNLVDRQDAARQIVSIAPARGSRFRDAPGQCGQQFRCRRDEERSRFRNTVGYPCVKRFAIDREIIRGH